MTKLLFLRHGLAEHNLPGFVGDQSRAQLTDLGQKQAESAGRRIASQYDLGGIYASPWFRTCQTAKIVAGCLPKVLVVWPDKRLANAEVAVSGRFWRPALARSLRPQSAAAQQHRVWAQKLRQTAVLETAASPLAIFLDDLRTNHQNQTILVVAHLPTYWVVHHLLTGLSIKQITGQRPFLAPGGWAEFDLPPSTEVLSATEPALGS